MANRDLTTFRSVTQQVVENKDQLLNAGADIAETILRQGEEAKLSEGFSVAQLDLAALDSKYKLDFQGDPTNKQGISKYKADRQSIYDGLEKNISPLYKSQWQEGTRKLTQRNDGMMQSWGLKQTQLNTVASVNSSMKNGLTQAGQDGRALGNGEISIEEALINFANTSENISTYAERNLGETTGNAAVQDYGEDHMKTLISGVSETNPLEAARILDNEAVKDSFSDPAQWTKMKKAVDARALNIQNINKDKEVLGILKNENALLTKSIQNPISYSELQQEFARKGTSKAAQSFFMKANGYSNGKPTLSASEKTKFKANVYKAIDDASQVEDLSSKDLTKFQDFIYEGMDRGALTRKEGTNYLNGLMTPVIANKEEFLEGFGRGSWNPFQDNIGFDGLKPILDDINIEAPEGEELGEIGQSINDQNTVELLDLYRNALTEEAANRDMQIGDVLNLPKEERIKIYTKAQKNAKWSFLSGRFPEIQNMKDNPPASIVGKDGQKINTGLGSGTPSSSISIDEPSMEFNNVEEAVAAGLPKGTRVLIDGRVAEIN